jgi:hypothetical protein
LQRQEERCHHNNDVQQKIFRLDPIIDFWCFGHFIVPDSKSFLLLTSSKWVTLRLQGCRVRGRKPQSLGGRRISLFFSSSLLKTFSMNAFQGQYLKRAEITRIAPIKPTISQKIPETKKERTIRMLPKMERMIDSCFPTFFVLTTGSTSSPY